MKDDDNKCWKCKKELTCDAIVPKNIISYRSDFNYVDIDPHYIHAVFCNDCIEEFLEMFYKFVNITDKHGKHE